jgi:hypothetical protein
MLALTRRLVTALFVPTGVRGRQSDRAGTRFIRGRRNLELADPL